MKWKGGGKFCYLLIAASLVVTSPLGAQEKKVKTYVGSKACAKCHQTEYNHWKNYSKMSHSFETLMRMKHDLTPEELKGCYECHTTGYGQPTGFQDPMTTPELKEVGCEACHGPGSVHVESNDPADIKTKITMKDCERCHNAERIHVFHRYPLPYGSAH